MNKIYIGGLNPEVTVESVTNLLNENSVEAGNIVVNKKGFAFADCKDAIGAEKAIEKLNGESECKHACCRNIILPSSSTPIHYLQEIVVGLPNIFYRIVTFT